jgi:hypothetical protein
LVLLGVAGYFLYSKMQLSSEISTKLEEQQTEFETLVKRKPHPGNKKEDNNAAARQQAQKLEEFAANARKELVPVAYPTNLDSGQFNLLVISTLDELRRKAASTGTKLPENCAFTFAPQQKSLQVETKDIPQLTRMLMEIKAIVGILFESKVLEIERIRRIPVAAQDTPGIPGLGGATTSDYWTRKPTTNDLAIVVPYEFCFKGFSSELQSVLQGLAKSPHSFVLKNLIIETGDTNTLDPFGMPTGGDGSAPQMTPQMMMMMRYGIGGRGMRGMAPPPEATTPSALPSGTIANEKPFRATLWVDVVRLRDPNEPKTAARGGGRTARSAAATDPAAAPADGAAAEDPAN